MTYKEVYRDWSYLWNIGPAYDMTGGYVDQEDLRILLSNPSKVTARDLLINQIEYWFEVGPDTQASSRKSKESLETLLREDREVLKIAYRHGKWEFEELEDLL